MYYNLLQNWQKPFTVEMYRKIKLSCFLLRSQLGRSIANRLIFYYINTPGFKKFHPKAVKGKVYAANCDTRILYFTYCLCTVQECSGNVFKEKLGIICNFRSIYQSAVMEERIKVYTSIYTPWGRKKTNFLLCASFLILDRDWWIFSHTLRKV